MSAFALPPSLLPPPEAVRLPSPYREELPLVQALAGGVQLDWPAVQALAGPWVAQVRANPAPFWAMESLLREYPITSAEGLALMRLAEALLRVPDAETAIALTADQLGRAQFDGAANAEGPHKMLAGLAASAISLSKKFLPDAEVESGLFMRLGAQTVVGATVRAIQLLGRQFVLGRNIQEAMREADAARKVQHGAQGRPKPDGAPAGGWGGPDHQLVFSYDMLGEGARSEHDAQRYQASYIAAIRAIAGARRAESPEAADGISIKLSALFSRYEVLQRERVHAELLPRVWQLVVLAAQANLNLTIDAEEVDRLELSLELLDALAARIAKAYPQWRGFGLAVQAYQTRALAVVEEVAAIARKHGLRFMVRLVKGAYWDGEIKRAQELGLEAYPVFTHKQHTDLSYLACAQALIRHADVIYPQFASHNAGTIAAILLMARAAGASFEMQRLHGMGEGVYRELLKDGSIRCRVYAPVGEHRDLLAYLVRRLLENGANSSFVHQLSDAEVGLGELLASPLEALPAEGPALPLPAQILGARRNSRGVDLTAPEQRAPIVAAIAAARIEAVAEAQPADVQRAMAELSAGFAPWSARPVAERAALLRGAAEALDQRLAEFCGLLVAEAHKTAGDCVAEVREAVDFLRYYADEAEAAGDTALRGRGVFVCISPWNFPLAIFAGQVAAALVAGNTVAAKPAEQTPYVALQMVRLLHAAGVPAQALALLHGPGETVGAALVADARTAGVCFTGSTQVAQIINRALAAKPGAPLPLIAETGGINAMVVDSTALPEQVVDAVVQSAFRSAGQRCSALRLLCVHESIAEGVIAMIKGALQELWVGRPAELVTDVGPLIDQEAFDNIQRHVTRLKKEARLIAEAPLRDDSLPRLLRPVAFEIGRMAELGQEIFGPVLHVLRWSGDVDAVIEQINRLGYGLTLGIQTRIDSRALRLAAKARIGNVYVNRNIIGAVVGVQPFGGEGLSGTGPKAGGPSYLRRFAAVAGSAVPGIAPAAAIAAGSGGRRGRQGTTLDFAALQRGFAAWSEQPLVERIAAVRRAAASLDGASAAVVQALARAAEQDLAPLALPGPTGESNELRRHGRGIFLLLGQGAALPAFSAALAGAVLAGNSVLAWPAEPGQAEVVRAFAAVLPSGLLLPGADDGEGDAQRQACLARPELAGVVLAGHDASLAQRLNQQLAQRPGAILPLITAAEALDLRQLYRFAAEQTLTINTAAAGGNAALLAGLQH